MQKRLSIGLTSIAATLAMTLFVGMAASAQEPVKRLPKKKKTLAPVEVIYSEPTSSESSSQLNSDGSAPIYQFNTDGFSSATDDRNNLNFKVDGSDESADPLKFTSADDVFKTYIGYPKHQLMAYYYPASVNAKWTYRGQDFNFTNSATTAFGLLYRFVATPLVNIELDWNHYELKVKEGTASAYTITASNTDIDSLFLRLNWFWVSDKNFFFRYGPGFELGYDSYPVLNFKTSTALELGYVRDAVIGLNFNVQKPLITNFLLSAKAGYNYGTGAGNSGEFTSKLNNSYYLAGGIDYNFNERSAINLGSEYRVRRANVEGKVGSNVDSWDTSATTTAFRAGYTYNF